MSLAIQKSMMQARKVSPRENQKTQKKTRYCHRNCLSDTEVIPLSNGTPRYGGNLNIARSNFGLTTIGHKYPTVWAFGGGGYDNYTLTPQYYASQHFQASRVHSRCKDCLK